jgi:hypothetical protein
MRYIAQKACNIVGSNTVFTVWAAYDIDSKRFDVLKRRLIKVGYKQAMSWNPQSTVFTKHRGKY